MTKAPTTHELADRAVRSWERFACHDLGEPERTQLVMVFADALREERCRVWEQAYTMGLDVAKVQEETRN